MTHEVDLLIVSADLAPLPAGVESGIARQQGVQLHVYRVLAHPHPADPNRWATIARGRNQAKRLGTSPWAMFLDDDVALDPSCVCTLVEQLRRRPLFGAIAADYLRELGRADPALHVSMGATLFRRTALDRITFRWEEGKCECLCCCNDLRKLRLGIDYCPQAYARHLTRESRDAGTRHLSRASAGTQSRDDGDSHASSASCATTGARILAAFDRRHYDLFRRQFLASLRASGNREWVTAVAYELHPSQLRALERLPRVEVLSFPRSAQSPPRRRLRDFQTAVAQLKPSTPVAYWDAGDVVFQASLQPLWELVQTHPDRLLAAREPGHPGTEVVRRWTQPISHPGVRRQIFELLSRRPYLAAGFAAATAESMLRYLRYAHDLRERGWLAHTTNYGDSACFNVYCRANPELWMEVDERWDYCIGGRDREDVYWDRGRYVSRRGDAICVVHGNRGTLPNVPHDRPRY